MSLYIKDDDDLYKYHQLDQKHIDKIKRLYIIKLDNSSLCFININKYFIKFNFCKNLINIYFNDTIDTINNLHILKCYKLTNINISNVNNAIFEKINLNLINFSNIKFNKLICKNIINTALVINPSIHIKHLIITNCKKLEVIYINNNIIDRLEILNCDKLITIYSNNNNNFEYINIQNNSNLLNINNYSNLLYLLPNSSDDEDYTIRINKRRRLEYNIVGYNNLVIINNLIENNNINNILYLLKAKYINIDNCNKLNNIYVNNIIIKELILCDCSNLNFINTINNNININNLNNIKCNSININNCNNIMQLDISGECYNNINIINMHNTTSIKIILTNNIIDNININNCNSLFYIDIDINNCKQTSIDNILSLYVLNIYNTFFYKLYISNCSNLSYLDSTNLLKFKFIDQTIENNNLDITNNKIIINNCELLYNIQNFNKIFHYVYLYNTPYVIYNKTTILDNISYTPDNRKCTICLENLYNPIFKYNYIKTECKHYFHIKCLYKWSDYNNNCPLCRTTIMQHNNYICPICCDYNNINSIKNIHNEFCHYNCLYPVVYI